MWAVVVLCVNIHCTNPDPVVILYTYTQEACKAYGSAVAEDTVGVLYFCADAREAIVED